MRRNTFLNRILKQCKYFTNYDQVGTNTQTKFNFI